MSSIIAKSLYKSYKSINAVDGIDLSVKSGQVFGFLGIDKTFECRDLSPRNVGANKTPVPREVYDYLNEYFKPHNKRLYSYLGRDFGW